MDIYVRLKELQLELPRPTPPGGEYVKVKPSGNYLYVSGQGPNGTGAYEYMGKLGTDLTLEEGKAAARNCAINILSCLHEYLGDLNRVKNVVKLTAFVASAPGFGQQPQVVNAASEIFIKVFGEKGCHARSAIGTNELPGNIPVEIEAIIEIE